MIMALKLPANDVIHYNRGVAYAKLGNHSQAISDYDKAIEINPGNAEAYYNRGIEYDELGNHLQAISDYDSAIDINPSYAEAYYNRGVPMANSAITGRRFQILTGPSRSILSVRALL